MYLQPEYNQQKHKLYQQEDSNLTVLWNYNNQLIFNKFKFLKLLLKWKDELLLHGSEGDILSASPWRTNAVDSQ